MHARVIRSVALAALASLAAGCGTRVGQVCKTDDECGRGFDCYYERCAHVCTKDEQCESEATCTRYRCLTAEGKVPNADPVVTSTPALTAASAGARSPNAATLGAPATPDAVAAELRALRRDVELLQQGQARIIELLEARVSGKKTTPARP